MSVKKLTARTKGLTAKAVKAKSPAIKPRERYSAVQKILLSATLVIFVGGAFLLSQWLLSFPFRWLYSLTGAHTLIQTLYSIVSYAAAIAIILLAPKIIKKSWKTTLEDLGLIGFPTFTDIGLAIVGVIIYFVLAAIFSSIFAALFPWFNATEAQDTGFNTMIFGPEKFLVLTVLVLIAPIAEEIIFRGYLYGKLKKVLVNPKGKRAAKIALTAVASILTSIVFGVMHGQWNVAVNVFAMSLVLCFLRETTGTIYAGILLHIIKNAIAFYLIYALGLGAY